MPNKFTTAFLKENFKKLEWLETNGLGGWASSSISGCNTRRYHGLLIAATNPPTERMALLSKLNEAILIGDKRFELGTNDYGDVIYPQGFNHLQDFTKEIFPEWIFEVDDIRMKKTIAMVYGQNTTVIMYEVLKSHSPLKLELLPLISARGYHSLQHNFNNIWWDVEFKEGIFKNRPTEHSPQVYISIPGASYDHRPCWFNKFNYSVDKYRGQDFEEDLFNHGIFTIEMKEGDTLGIIVSTNDPAKKSAHDLLAIERKRREMLLQDAGEDEMVKQLMLAADQFIVERKIPGSNHTERQQGATVIAGYHWFTDWGRDTMISLPGLCIATGRHDNARKIIAAFASSVSMGMLPNRFQDNGEDPEYNTVDATLWFFIAVYKYLLATDARQFILHDILPVLKNIIEWHRKGTRYQIHETSDGLLYSGQEGVQLTWMDAKIGDWVVTPRTGKAVEVNALWYSALCIFSELLVLNSEYDAAKEVQESAAITKKTFNEQFWNEKENCLFDVVNDDWKDDTIRPNQLFAVSLPFPLVEECKARSILEIVTEKLYTPVGLRTLPADHQDYIGVYGGNALQRDSAYHQGTVWSWLIGPYIDALVKTDSMEGLLRSKRVINNFKYHLNEGAVGTVSEIFDGDAPHSPRGCVAQAWGVAEVLRVIKEYSLSEGPSSTRPNDETYSGESIAGNLL
jgi:predicted glycogen debranching enzyme